jgi:hypothetical protein
VLLGTLAFASAPASAENVHVLTQTITPLGGTALSNPRSIAIDNSSGPSSGDIYVADTSNHRIVKLDPSGSFLLMWGLEVNEGTGNPNICTNVGPPTDVCRAGRPGNGAGIANQPYYMAVDSSAGPSAGDIYVSVDPGNAGWIQKFDPTGHLITSWGGTPFPGAMDGSTAPNGPFGFGQAGLDVDAGNLYVWNYSDARVFKFAQDGTSPSSFTSPARPSIYLGFAVGGGKFFKTNRITESVNSIEAFGPGGADIGQVDSGDSQVQNRALEYDTAGSNLFAVTSIGFYETSVRMFHFNGSGEVVQADSSTCVPAPELGCTPTETFGQEELTNNFPNPNDVAVNASTGKVYVVNSSANNVMVFSQINVPKVTTGAYSNLERDSVKFSGHVEPDGAGDITTCEFDFGPTTTYGTSAPCVPAPSSTPTAVSAQLPSKTLTADTTYHYRIVAGNANGNRTGKDMSFATPPAVGGVTTDSASNIARLSTTLNGSFTGDGVDTSYYFEYGPSQEYGQKTPDVDQGTGAGTQNVSANITQLFSYYYYHYRLVTHNKYGKTVGADKVVLTLPPDLPAIENTFSSGVDQDSAMLNTEIDPGEGWTLYRFEYGLSDAYGLRTLAAGPIEPEDSNHTGHYELSNLTPGTTYHFRAVAINFAGTVFGPDQKFTTPSEPVIASTSASGTSRTGTTLNAMVNPGLSLTTYHFDYGTSPSYGASTPESAPIGPDSAIHATSAVLAGLVPGTVYHFRAVATNGVGTTAGIDQTFTTLPPEFKHEEEETKPCKKGFVRKHGRCVRRKHPRPHRGHHRHAGRRHG